MTSLQTVTPELRQWIIEQAQAGCRPDDVLAAMRGSGWDEATALDALSDTLQSFLGAQAPGKPVAQVLPVPVRVPEPALAGAPSSLWAHDRQVQVLLTMHNPRVVVFGGLLSDDECDALVAAAAPRMARSETVVNETGGNEVNASRTSDGMFFGRGELPICQTVEARIAALVNWPLVNGEGLQVLHYRPGAEYKPHHDYFDPAQPGMAAVLRRGGQRVGTIVMYLNTPKQGGGTVFPDVQLEVAPIKGNAVFFSYNRPHAITRSLHGGTPVLAGEKWVATKWLREGEFS
ncbi:MAG: 2OG-Fe(II) oxygenase [Aquabacterium sp.]|nr:2OG-Fe(II) oxygenase [Aquabacterium sp.]